MPFSLPFDPHHHQHQIHSVPFSGLYIRSFPSCPSLCPRFNIVSRLSIGLQIKRTLFASETQP
ncbi:hypothetical protein NC652_021010 [Populus alba x Populus x berolinensis]|uniref:Uncharacterized protein n=1 Tax=Populus alba x Populus x berolinensis TaxID=444605 RepID=A0AAD6MLW0_9ROSI|nr:hypothetical protein NC652_021010 [Populus alba x Populus x berolinensis]KAJ6987717.1 hypothetical protein NC653_020848 [Populus alba x Populus x berolinensis]